jgi:DNA-binding CsgD family transcriptional regulator
MEPDFTKRQSAERSRVSPAENALLDSLIARRVGDARLAPAERRELRFIAAGQAAKDAAAAGGISPETVRCRRNELYRKLRVTGANEIQVGLLALALERLARKGDSRSVA